jgi:hypothetical protein
MCKRLSMLGIAYIMDDNQSREAPVGIEPTNSRFAVCRLTTWPRRRKKMPVRWYARALDLS